MEKFWYILCAVTAAALTFFYFTSVAPYIGATPMYSVVIVGTILSALILAGLTIIEKYSYPSWYTVRVVAQWLLILLIAWITWLIISSMLA
jgi:hypothetical protein